MDGGMVCRVKALWKWKENNNEQKRVANIPGMFTLGLDDGGVQGCKKIVVDMNSELRWGVDKVELGVRI